MSRRKKNTPSGNSKAPVVTADAFSNPLYRIGYGSQSPLEATEYPLTRMTDNYALLNSLYRDNWVVQNVVGIIPDDMTKEWFTLSGDIAPDQRADFDRLQRVTQLQSRINEGLRWGRLYGGAGGLILIKGQENMLEEPLDLETILPGSFVGLYIFDRWCGITPDMGLVNDMADPDFGLPEYYTINGEESRIIARVHHSRIIRFTGRELPFLEKIAEMYWGESEIEALYHDVVKHDNVSNNMAALTFRANTDTMEVENLNQLFSLTSTEQQRRFWNTMQAQTVVKSNFGMQLVNKGDQITNTQYSFAGFPEVYDSMCLDLAGAARIPVTKLFGRSPAGMNATGESDLRNYYDYVDTLRESKLRPILEKLLPVLCFSLWGGVPDGIEINFPTLWTPTAMEIADIALKKAQAIRDTFQAGLFQADTAQRELKALAEETGMFGSITDEEIAANAGKTYQDVTALKDPLAGLTFGEETGEESAPFEEPAADSLTMDYAPDQPRDKNGRWTNGGSSGIIKHKNSNGVEFTTPKPKEFLSKLKQAKKSQPDNIAWRVDDYSHTPEDYGKDKLYQTDGGSVVAVTPDGDIISVCGKRGDSVRGSELLKMAVENGGKKLDAFSGLYGFYRKNGFEPVSWCKFDKQYAPPGWKESYEEEPVIFWKYTGRTTKYEKYEDFTEAVPANKDYDSAQAARDKSI